MRDALKVALEFLSLSAKTQLPAELLSCITTAKEKTASGELVDPVTVCHELGAIIRRITHLNLTVEYNPNIRNNAYAVTTWFTGHSGVMGRMGSKTEAVKAGELYQQLDESVVDLERVRVTGLFSKIPAVLGLAGNFFEVKCKLTPEEITAILLHELGHVFTIFATVGEYVWLNYYLTDGVDVLLGKKSNTYKIQTLDKSYLENNLADPALVEEIKKQPTEANIRRALLESTGTIARDQFNSRVSLGSIKRSEQTADLFATRLGFGRALVTGLDKITGFNPSKSTLGHVLFEASKLAITVMSTVFYLTVPVMTSTVYGLILSGIFTMDVDPYDALMERYLKVKRELIFQLRQPTVSSSEREALLDDIKHIETVIKGMNDYRTLLQTVSQFIYPPRRRDAHRLLMEQQLERLMNNDLFLASAKLKTLA